MATRQVVIRDYAKRIAGYLETQDNGDIWVFDFSKRLLGKYIKSMDCTYTYNGKLVAYGNYAAGLLNIKI